MSWDDLQDDWELSDPTQSAFILDNLEQQEGDALVAYEGLGSYSKEDIPVFDGLLSFFGYEEKVQDWLDVTKAPNDKQGPLLKAKLTGTAAQHKPLLDRAKLKSEVAEAGVKYLLDYLKPHYLKGAQNVFLWRFFKIMACRRGGKDFHSWITRFTIIKKNASDAWMDLLPDDGGVSDPDFLIWINRTNQEALEASMVQI